MQPNGFTQVQTRTDAKEDLLIGSWLRVVLPNYQQLLQVLGMVHAGL